MLNYYLCQAFEIFFFLGHFWSLFKIFYLERIKNSLVYYIKEGLHGRIFMTIRLIHICYTSIILLCMLKENFQKSLSWIFCFFSYSYQDKNPVRSCKKLICFPCKILQGTYTFPKGFYKILLRFLQETYKLVIESYNISIRFL